MIVLYAIDEIYAFCVNNLPLVYTGGPYHALFWAYQKALVSRMFLCRLIIARLRLAYTGRDSKH